MYNARPNYNATWNFKFQINHSFIHSGDLYSASSRDYYSEAQ